MPNQTMPGGQPQPPRPAAGPEAGTHTAPRTAGTGSAPDGPAKTAAPGADSPRAASTRRSAGNRAPRRTRQFDYAATNIRNANRRPPVQKSRYPIPWWLVVLAFVFATPVGVGLLILNILLSQRDKLFSSPQQFQSPYQPPAGSRQSNAAAAPVRNRNNAGSKRTADVMMVIGTILTAIGGLATLGSVFENLWILTEYSDIAWFLECVWPPAIVLFGGLSCAVIAQRVRNAWQSRHKIIAIVGDADYMYLDDIAGALGCGADKCVDQLESCILSGVFGPNAYLDMRSRALVVRGRPPKVEEKPEPAPEPQPEPEAEESRYDKILKELRQVNDAIPDEEMSTKISRLEAVAAKIFAQIQSDPDKLPQLRKFMDYYLPTSLKLLNTYAELEAQGVEGANITESKHRIERSMDTLVTAFENQLDKLFQDDALDVSTDIEVMEKMLSADGLVGDSDPFGLKNHSS